MMINKQIKRSISGILLLNKSQGLSSNQALQKVKHLFCARKAGHTGSLDPMATGMLPICFGEASKFSQYLLDADKQYLAMAKLGVATDTGDATGQVVDTNNKVSVDATRLEQVCTEMLGISEQVPPMYSALKHKGQPLYKLARQGISIERQPRPIEIKEIKLHDLCGDSFTFWVRCSKGTYIRTLIEDISAKLGYYAHMTALHRIATAGFEAKPMYDYETLVDMTDTDRDACLLPCDLAVSHFPSIELDDATVKKLQQGQKIESTNVEQNVVYRIYKNNQFYGLVKSSAPGELAAVKLLAYST